MSAEVTKHVKEHPNPVAKLWLAMGGTDLETQVMHAPGCEPKAHARIDESSRDYPLAHPPHRIGSTGRNWVDSRSIYLFFDIDSKAGHAAGHDDDAIQRCIDARPEYVTLFRSKSGKGLGAMVCLDPPPYCPDRASHQALGDRLRLRLAADGFPAELIDVCGGIGWLWAADAQPGGYKIIREASRSLDPDDLPPPILPERKLFNGGSETPAEAPRKLMAALHALGCVAVWQADQGCLHTHSWGLAQLHMERHLPGRFTTLSEGKNLQQPNCFFFPSGDWSGRVVRFGKGCKEHVSWEHGEWTSCAYGEPLSFQDACKLHGGSLTERGAYVLTLGQAVEVVAEIAGVRPEVSDASRQATVSKSGSGLVIDLDPTRKEECPSGFRKHGRKWRMFISAGQPDSLDGKVYCGRRHGAAGEWFSCTDGRLTARSKDDCRSALSDIAETEDVIAAINRAANHTTEIVKVPFKPQLYNGCLNPDAVELVCDPQTSPATEADFPHWMGVFRHTGHYLDDYLATGWGAEHGINGARYIMCWLAIALKTPEVRLPFLAFFGDQLSGKRSFATAIEVLAPGGVYQAAKQLRTDDKFDSRMEGMPFVFVDEVDLSKPGLFEYLKGWISEPLGVIRAMYSAPRSVVNYTHWMQAVNRVEFLPVFDDTSRITALRLDVIPLEKRLNREELKAKLRAEAPAVLRFLFDLALPPGDGRLALPAIDTDLKDVARGSTDDPLNRLIKIFIAECCQPGESASLKDFRDAFLRWDVSDRRVTQMKLATTLTNCGFTVRNHSGSKRLIGFEVQA